MGKKQPYKLEKSVSTLSTLVRVIWVVGPCYESIIKFPHGLAREKSYTPKFVTFLPFLFVTAIAHSHSNEIWEFDNNTSPHCFILFCWIDPIALFDPDIMDVIYFLSVEYFYYESLLLFWSRPWVFCANIGKGTNSKYKRNWNKTKMKLTKLKKKKIDNISIGLNNWPTMLYGMNKPPPSPLLEHVFDSISTQNTF